jgi:hypothetical protein
LRPAIVANLVRADARASCLALYSFSGVSSVSAPAGTFSATYDNYVIRFNNLASSVEDWASIRMRAAGVDDSGANYRQQSLQANNTTLTGARSVNNTSWLNVCYQNTSIPNVWTFEIQNPFLTEVTAALQTGAFETAGNINSFTIAYGVNTTTSYDSFSLIPASGLITGSMSVYGFNK